MLIANIKARLRCEWTGHGKLYTTWVELSRHSLLYNFRTIWLFAYSDLFTIIGPETLFAMLSVLSGPVLTNNAPPSVVQLFTQLPSIAFWIWINLLPFAVDNQRHPKAVQEDLLNKPWRPLPSGRISQSAAEGLMLILYPCPFFASLYLGAVKHCLAGYALGYLYNSRKGADESCIVRNLINTLGFVCFSSGSTIVASRNLQVTLSPAANWWFLIIGGIVFTTVQLQDMPDQAGDSVRRRNTIPLVLGDWQARWTVVVPVAFWSCFCPYFWGLSMAGYAGPIFAGTILAWRVLAKRNVQADRLSFRIWSLWMVLLYLLPLIKRLDGNQLLELV